MGPCLCGDPYCMFCGNLYDLDDIEVEELENTTDDIKYIKELNYDDWEEYGGFIDGIN